MHAQTERWPVYTKSSSTSREIGYSTVPSGSSRLLCPTDSRGNFERHPTTKNQPSRPDRHCRSFFIRLRDRGQAFLCLLFLRMVAWKWCFVVQVVGKLKEVENWRKKDFFRV